MTRLSRYFLPTTREDPADAEAASHRLTRARRPRPPGRRPACGPGCRPAGAPTARSSRSCARSSTRSARCEMLMPVLQPAELWKRTGRYEIDELFKLRDRRGAELVLAMTHEEDVTFHVVARDPLLPRPAEDALPLPDQGARRAAPARRRAAHARVHHEGLLLVRPRRGGPRRAPTSCTSRPTTAIFDRTGLEWYRVESRRGDDGRHRRARVHGALRRRRERRRAVGRRLRRQRGDRERHAPARRRAARAARRARAGRDARRHHHRGRDRHARRAGRAR